MSGDKDSPKFPSNRKSEEPLGKSLREQYKRVLKEPIPENLQKLIEALKEKERREKKK